jgi:hypothetical protein
LQQIVRLNGAVCWNASGKTPQVLISLIGNWALLAK